ncbi:YiiD C-terminal domain-containing protein [Dokdonella soli]
MNDHSGPDASARAARAAAALGREILADIPLTRAMGLSIVACDSGSLTLAAPLAPNINDKGCAFGGSLASLMTLAGWGLIKLATDARELDCEIYVQDSTIRYLAPVWQDFVAVARLAEGEHFDDFFGAITARGKGRLRVHCTVPLAHGGAAATLEARFVALAKR